ncbi:unnamed protein product [Moneuplotes crassus]|uniref:Uncharacterized protein n=1 Tax=Euplotes crassus TaxID=5936 RepID=A0AAD1X4N2_EUPCR|nr:unnamed protein product [Moneuplotes crassus]
MKRINPRFFTSLKSPRSESQELMSDSGIQKVVLHPEKMIMINQAKTALFFKNSQQSKSKNEKSQTIFSNKRISNGFGSAKAIGLLENKDSSPMVYPKIIRPSEEIIKKINLSKEVKKFRCSTYRGSKKLQGKSRYVTLYQKMRRHKSQEKLARDRRLATLNSMSYGQLFGNYKQFINKIKSGNLQRIKKNNTNFPLKNLHLRPGAFSPDLSRGLYPKLSHWKPPKSDQLKSIITEIEKPVEDSPMKNTDTDEESESSLSQKNIKYTTVVKYFSDSKQNSVESSEISEYFEDKPDLVIMKKSQKNFAKYIERAVRNDLYQETKENLAHKPDSLHSIKDIESVIEKEKWKKEHYDRIKFIKQAKYFSSPQGGYYKNNFSINNKYLNIKRSLSRVFNIEEKEASKTSRKTIKYSSKIHLKELCKADEAAKVKVGTRTLQKRIRKEKY